MAKRILYIVLGAIVVFGLLFLLWSWFFNRPSTGQTTGTFGTASSTNQSGTGGQSGNGETQLTGPGGAPGGNESSTNGITPLGNKAPGGAGGGGATGVGSSTGSGGSGSLGSLRSAGLGGSSLGTLGSLGTIGFGTTSTSTGGGIWLGGGAPFNPTPINSISSGGGGSAPTIRSPIGGGSGGTTLVEALAATAIAGSLSCAIQAGILTLSTTNSTAGVTAVAGFTQIPPIPGSSPGVQPNIVADYGVRNILATNYTAQATRNTGKDNVTFLGCITNTIAKVALQQLTISTVNWINSGFNGKPAFVNNFQQFFTNVADAAAGQFIQGSGLAFLCSPFKLQIKIAIAKAYAQRNNAQSCTLTGVIKNVNNFMNGQFAQGGWPGFISFTTMPTNNPYGAFAYAQVGLNTAQSSALTNARNNISPTGFLALQKVTCSNGSSGGAKPGDDPAAIAAGGSATLPPGCRADITTPGQSIQDSLQQVTGVQVNQLGLANDLDQIISALTTQLTTKLLQHGLTSLSQTTTQTPADLAAQSQAQALLTSMQNNITLTQELGSVYQGSIGDLEDAQNRLNDLANCWSAVASSTSASSTQAAINAQNARTQIDALQQQIDTFNNNITGLNNTIATLNQLEYNLTTAATVADVTAVANSYNAAAANFPTQNDVTTAQQDRTTLQGKLGAINQQTAASLQQCQATH